VTLLHDVAPRGLGTLSGLVLLLTLTVSSATDLAWRRIPNWATYPAAGFALAINLAAWLLGAGAAEASDGRLARLTDSLGAIGMGSCCAGALVCFGIMFFVFGLAGGGAGDVKLATVIGAYLGPQQGLAALCFTYLAAGAAMVGWAILTVGPLKLGSAVGRQFGSFLLPGWISRPSADELRFLRQPTPLAVFFAIGALAALFGWTIPS
jgi:prepilin peptidase CpaA